MVSPFFHEKIKEFYVVLIALICACYISTSEEPDHLIKIILCNLKYRPTFNKFFKMTLNLSNNNEFYLNIYDNYREQMIRHL